jgi:hypothetical protein
VKTVYWIVGDLRAADPRHELQARDVNTEYERRVDAFVGESTVYHALTKLCQLGLVVKRGRLGWALAIPSAPR